MRLYIDTSRKTKTKISKFKEHFLVYVNTFSQCECIWRN